MRIVLAENLEYTLGARDLLAGVNLELRHGDRLALVGANGSGKTTLMRLLVGALEPTAGRIHRSEGVHLELLAQDPLYDPNDTVESVLKRGFARVRAMEAELARLEAHLADLEVYQRWEALHERYQAIGGYQQRARYEAVLKGLRFAGREQEKASVLSGGEARRLALGALLLSGADALLLDEPTNHLDLEMTAWLVGFLQSYGGAILTVSHDRRFLDQVTQRVAWLRRGQIRLYEGNYSAFRRERALQEEQEAREYANWLKEKERREGILEQAQRWAHSSAKHARRLHSLEARMAQFMEEAVQAPEAGDPSLRIRFPLEKEATAERVLEGWELQKTLGGRPLFYIPHLLVRKGERIALIGPNGAGKTTLINLIAGMLPPSRGQLRFQGENITHLPAHQRVHRGLARTFQITNLFKNYTVRTNLELAVQARAGSSFRFWQPVAREKHLTEAALAVAEQVGLAGRFERVVGQLSHGEQRQLEVGLALASRPRLLLLDEPMAGLGAEESERMVALIAQLAQHHTILLVEHDMGAVFRLARRISVLVYGQVIASGSPAEIRANPEVHKAYLGDEGGAK